MIPSRVLAEAHNQTDDEDIQKDLLRFSYSKTNVNQKDTSADHNKLDTEAENYLLKPTKWKEKVSAPPPSLANKCGQITRALKQMIASKKYLTETTEHLIKVMENISDRYEVVINKYKVNVEIETSAE